MIPLVPKPEDITPMEPKEFMEAYQFAASVADGSIPDQIRSPSDHKFLVEGRVASFADVPFMRFGLSLAQLFRGRDAMMQTFMFRFQALQEALDAPSLSEFVRERNGREVHPAVFHAAAAQPLTANLRFDEASFAEAVRAIAENEQDE